MKNLLKYIVYTTVLFATGINTYGQTITIPDPVLTACIVSKFPQVIDTNKRLILAEAAKITDPFICRSKSLKNAEGVQYFVNITKLDISYNQLTYLPDITALKKLQVLDISDNRISQIGSFSALTALSDLDLKNNLLTKFPDFSKNTKLEVLSAFNNLVDTLPSLNGLVKLKQLFLQENKLSALPPLQDLVSLTYFDCSNNKLVSIPSIANLKELGTFNASSNKITALPEFPSGTKIHTLLCNNNRLEKLPNLSKCDSLKSAAFQGNRLTFEDFYDLSTIKNYATIFQLNPQEKSHIGKSISIFESESLLLSTGIDTLVKNMSYEWVFQGKTFGKNSRDGLLLNSVTSNNSGYYYAKLTNSLFPEVVLETDSFLVTVNQCINLANISTTIVAQDCEHAGSLKIFPATQPYEKMIYSLKGQATGKIISSTTGIFEQLLEPTYTLSITAGNGCTKDFSTLITIPGRKCDYPFITPNGDGIDDTYFFKGKGKANISDKWGNTILTVNLPIEWDGMKNAELVSPGLYLVNINEGEELVKITVLY